jgi:hypothetical protein
MFRKLLNLKSITIRSPTEITDLILQTLKYRMSSKAVPLIKNFEDILNLVYCKKEFASKFGTIRVLLDHYVELPEG